MENVFILLRDTFIYTVWYLFSHLVFIALKQVNSYRYSFIFELFVSQHRKRLEKYAGECEKNDSSTVIWEQKYALLLVGASK